MSERNESLKITTMNRSRSKSRLFETAFVTRTKSSTEDLDEVDRLANHPALRPEPKEPRWRRSKLRKSRSEMGGSSLGFSPGLSGAAPTSNQSSPLAATSGLGMGYRTVAVGGRVNRMKRSTTINFQQFYGKGSSNWTTSSNNSTGDEKPTGPSPGITRTFATSALKDLAESSRSQRPPSPSSSQWTEGAFGVMVPSDQDISQNNILSTSLVVTSAVVEAPPTEIRPDTAPLPSLDAEGSQTPPATATLPAKFQENKMSPPQNLLVRRKKNSQGTNSGSEIENVEDIMSESERASNANSPSRLRFSLQMSLAQRFKGTSQAASQEGMLGSQTPPATTPLSAKFQGDKMIPPHNLLMRCKKSPQGKNGPDLTETSGSEAPEEGEDIDESKKFSTISPPPPKFSLQLSLVQRLKGVVRGGSNSSSADSTPQKRPVRKLYHPPPSRQLIQQTKVRLQQSLRPSSPSCRTSPTPPPVPRPKRISMAVKSYSCSSAMSSLESVGGVSSVSDFGGMASSSGAESGLAVSLCSHGSDSAISSSGAVTGIGTKAVLMRPSLSKQFQVLSPISDKSQDQNLTPKATPPKVSPTDQFLNACCAGPGRGNDNDNDEEEVNGNRDTRTGCKDQVPVPFAMPKLHRKLRQNDPSSSAMLKGSDSGISMTSQDVQDMFDLLGQQLPFDMPKLRRKTQQILQSSRPNSMPTSDLFAVNIPASTTHDTSSVSLVAAKEDISGFPSKKTNNINNLNNNAASIAPPPPAFQDNEFYLCENGEKSGDSHNANQSLSGMKVQDLFPTAAAVKQAVANYKSMTAAEVYKLLQII